ELLHALDAAQEARRRALERGARQFRADRFEPGPLVGAVTGALDQAEICDVARDRGLRRVEPALTEAPPELLLAVEGFMVDDFEDHGLPARFHQLRRTPRIHDSSSRVTSIHHSIHRFSLIESIVACISILSDAYSCAVPCTCLERKA